MSVVSSARVPYKAVDGLLERNKGLSIRRIGKDIVLIADTHRQVLSGNKIKTIVNSVNNANSTIRIRTSGLSKAQVEKIAGSFVSDKAEVEVRHVSRQKSTASQLQRYEIVVKGGKDSV